MIRKPANSSPGPKMKETRAGHTATLLDDGRVLIAGGHGDPSAEIYNPATNSFAPPLPDERQPLVIRRVCCRTARF